MKTDIQIAKEAQMLPITAIAKKLGISQQTISHYIKGDKMPALDTFANLCVIIVVTNLP